MARPDGVRVITDNNPRDIIVAHELTPKERAEFDYLDWPKIDRGEDSASFFRYRGQLYDLGEFMRGNAVPAGAGLPPHLSKWDGHRADSAFSAVVVRYTDENERVVVGTALS